MSRLTDLIAQAKAKDAALGQELEREFRALSARRAFGLNFERHKPESVELPGRPIRKGDKVRILPPRGSTAKGDQRLWRVLGFDGQNGARQARLERIGSEPPDRQSVSLADLIVVAEFKDYIYPGLVSTGKVERGGDKAFHTVINGENFHVLEALTFTHRGKIDAIYIDPPYNTGARDWKYNNDYVEGDDLYRHSKWLAMMERRLLVARQLLNPEKSVLIVAIDEKEYLRLGLLLEQTFPEASMQSVTVVINPSGASGEGLSRVEEYLFLLRFGNLDASRVSDDLLTDLAATDGRVKGGLSWESFLRSGSGSSRADRPNLCYPIAIDPETHAVCHIGEPLLGKEEDRPRAFEGFPLAWPIRTDGTLGMWRRDRKGLMELLEAGYAYVSSEQKSRGTWSLKYLLSGTIKRINAGELEVERTGKYGQVESKAEFTKKKIAKTVWYRPSHNAGKHGSDLLANVLAGRRFPYPKSLYAVEDAIRLFVADNPVAIILDFFSGSGTTAHAVMRLNRQDGGKRQCISVTNNEVGANEQKKLREAGLRPGDPEWEKWGICDHITKPRIKAAITGKTPEGEPIKGDYKFTDEFPMAEGIEENAEFFTLTYEAPVAVSHNRAFERIAPLLWIRAGSEGRRIDALPEAGWEVAETYGLLTDLDAAGPFAEAIAMGSNIRVAYIVTDDERRFQAIVRQLPETVEPVRLYESYLTNFRFAMGR